MAKKLTGAKKQPIGKADTPATKPEAPAKEIAAISTESRRELETLVKKGRGDLLSSLEAGAKITKLAADSAATIKDWCAKNMPSIPYPTISAMCRTAKVATQAKSSDNVTPIWSVGAPLPKEWEGWSENALRSSLGTGGVPTKSEKTPDDVLKKATKAFISAWTDWGKDKSAPELRTRFNAIYEEFPQSLGDVIVDILANDDSQPEA